VLPICRFGEMADVAGAVAPDTERWGATGIDELGVVSEGANVVGKGLGNHTGTSTVASAAGAGLSIHVFLSWGRLRSLCESALDTEWGFTL
jgi:hypothetical protein